MRRIFGSIAGTLVLSCIAVATAAAGGSTSVNGYGGVAGTIQSSVKSNGTLPFTGLDIGLIAGVACAVLIAGVTMRRLSHPRS
jgi:hypothetical protein